VSLVAELEPDERVVRLASTLSLAARIEPALLREARLELHRDLDLGVEGDLWFSPLVEVRSPSGVVLEGDEVLEELRAMLAADQDLLERASVVTTRIHAKAAPALVLEERLAYLGLQDPVDGTAIDRAIESVRAAMLEGDGSRAERLARWTARAAARLPRAVRERESAWKLLLHCSLHFDGLGPALGEELPASARAWLEQLLPADPPRRWIGVGLAGDAIELADEPTDGHLPLAVPDTEPAIVTVDPEGAEPEQIPLAAGETRRVALPPAGTGRPRIFISHDRTSEPHVRETVTALQLAGFEVVRADLYGPSQSWPGGLGTMISQADGAVILLTPSMRDSKQFRVEAPELVARAQTDASFRLLPVAIETQAGDERWRGLGLEEFQFLQASGPKETAEAVVTAMAPLLARSGPPDGLVELRTATGELHRLHRMWTAMERVRGYAEALHTVCLAFHVRALAPEGERGRASPEQFGRDFLLRPGQFDAVSHAAEWAMNGFSHGRLDDLGWGDALAAEYLVDFEKLKDPAELANAFLFTLRPLLKERLEHGDFDWTSGVGISPQAWRLLQVNVAEVELSTSEWEYASEGQSLLLHGRYSAVVRMFELCAERLVAAIRHATASVPEDAFAAREDTLRRLVRFWPPLTVAEHTPEHLGHHAQGPEPEYIPRDVDPMLDEALAQDELVVVAGLAHSGHRRCALEALRRRAPSAPLWVPEDGRGFARLALDPGTPALPGSLAYLRLLEPFLGNHGLTPATLAGFLERTHAMAVVGTMSDLGRPLDDLRLAELGARIVYVDRNLSEAELERARRLFPEEAEAMAKAGIPRAFDARDDDGMQNLPA
jgi:hypothetical protein